MNRFTLLSHFRSLTRHKLYAAINIGGLAIGIAVFLVLSLYVKFETSFEKWLPRYHEIYVVQTVWNLPGNPSNGANSYTMGGLLDQIREDFPGTAGTRIRGGKGAGTILRGGVAVSDDVVQVDPTFFDVFDLPMVRGNGRQALSSPTGAVISASAARKYFGSSDPVGQTLTVTMDAPAVYRIAGVFRDLPKNSDLALAIITPLPRTPPSEQWFHWGSSMLTTYLRFETLNAARNFETKMPAFVNRRAFKDMGQNASATIGLSLLPITGMHFAPQGSTSSSGGITVATLGIVGLLTLLMAIVNYVNLATARAGLRAREVAMRKVVGADSSALIHQFLGEAMLTVAVAALTGLILAEISLPLVNAASGLSLTIPYVLVVPALAALIVVVGLLAGFYPAVLLSRFPAAAVLASAHAPGGGRAGTRIREGLVMLQFGLAITFIIGTTVLVAQTRHVRQTDLGFKREGLQTVLSLREPSVGQARMRSVVAAISALPGVKAVGVANDAVGGSGTDNSDNVRLPGVSGDGPSLRWVLAGPGFFDAYAPRLIAGRVFDDAHGADDAEPTKRGEPINIVINQHAVSTLRFRSPQDAIGKTVGVDRPRTIIGVVDDLRFASPRSPNSATYYMYYRDITKIDGAVASIRSVGDPASMRASIGRLWTELVPEIPFDGESADRRLAQYYETDERATRLFSIGAGLAVLIGCVGLWGLASFNTQRRVREIGIRKALGASSPQIVKLLVGQFLRPVLVANIIAWPLAFIAMRAWLTGFDDRITLSPLYFIGSSLIVLLIAVLTVLGHSLRASRAAPAWALRHD